MVDEKDCQTVAEVRPRALACLRAACFHSACFCVVTKTCPPLRLVAQFAQSRILLVIDLCCARDQAARSPRALSVNAE